MNTSLGIEAGITIVVAFLIALAVDRTPTARMIAYPLLLFITFVHELGHGLVAIVTGGEFRRFIVRRNQSGVAWYAGGWDLFVIPAGYVGTAVFSAALILLTSLPDSTPLVLGGLGVLVILLVLAFGLTSFTTILGGIGAGGVLILLGIYTGDVVSLFIVSLIAFISCLETLSSLRGLRLIARWDMAIQNDAQDMADSFGCTATFWAWLWSLTSILMVGWAMWFAWFRNV